MSNASGLQGLLDAQPKPECAALIPFSVEDADFEHGRVVLRFASQPAFRNHFGDVQSSFVAPMKLGECRGEGGVIKAGQQLVFLEARLWGADGRLAVHATAIVAAARE